MYCRLNKIKAFFVVSLFFLTMMTVFMPSVSASDFAGGDGSVGDPYQITHIEHLYNVRYYLDKNFILMNNLDFEDDSSYIDSGNKAGNITGSGWLPIGDYRAEDDFDVFEGNFNGQNFTISNLFIDYFQQMIGLFGLIFDGATVSNLGLIDVDIKNVHSYIGSLVGYVFNASIYNCYASGDIDSSPMSDFMGGLIGVIGGSSTVINNSYSSVDISGHMYIGGFTSSIYDGSIINSYSTGSVYTSYARAGGFIAQKFDGNIINCFWDKQTSGQDSSDGGTGKTTTQMKDYDTFNNAGWDIVKKENYNVSNPSTWYIDDGNSYPQLSSEYTYYVSFTDDTVTPNEGIESLTSFNWSVTCTDEYTEDLTDMRVVISKGAWKDTADMIWLSGDNTTGANYYYERTLPSVGTYSYYFTAYNGRFWNSTSVETITVNPNTSFSFNFPVFLEVGQYIQAHGTISDDAGNALDEIWVYTKIQDSDDWSTVSFSSQKHFMKDGAYHYSFSTSTMKPGVYHIVVNFTYTGENFLSNWTFYLSDYSGPGHYITNAFFVFYNEDTGIGIPYESFKIYASNSLPLTNLDRIYDNKYINTYTGETLYYRVDDYFDNQIYPTSGTYDSFVVSSTNYIKDVPITWNSFSVKNMNSSIVHFSIANRIYSDITKTENFDDDTVGQLPTSDWYTTSNINGNTLVTSDKNLSESNSLGFDFSSFCQIYFDLNEPSQLNNIDFSIFTNVTTPDGGTSPVFSFMFYDGSIKHDGFNIDTFNNLIKTRGGDTIGSFDYDTWYNYSVLFNHTTQEFRIMQNDNSLGWHSFDNSIITINQIRFIQSYHYPQAGYHYIDDFEINCPMSTSGSREYSKYIFPYDSIYWNVLDGDYIVNLTYENPLTKTVEQYHEEIISITDDAYYWIEGYDLRDIIVSIYAVNTSLGDLILNISVDVNLTDSDINNITTTIITNIEATETNITNLILNQHANFTFIESIINSMNTSILADITAINSSIDTINNIITVNFSVLNSNISYLNSTIWGEFTTVNSNINTQTNTIHTYITNQDVNISTMNTNIINYIEIIDTNITYMNNSIHNAISIVDSVVGEINTKLNIDFTLLNATVNNIDNKINIDFVMLQSNVTNMNNSIHTSISILDSNVTNMNTSIQNAISIVDSIVDYMNTTIWNEITTINSTINAQTNTISTQINTQNTNISYMNTSIHNSINIINANITNMNTSIHNILSLIDSTVEYLNYTIWNTFQDINTNITRINQSITYVNDTIWQNFTFIGQNITDATVNIKSYIDLSEMNLSSLNLNIWSNLNLTDSVINHLNNTIWSNLTAINAEINTINNKINIDLTALNTNITNLNTNIWANLTLIESEIDSMNNTVITQISIMDSNISSMNNTIQTRITVIDSNITNMNNSIHNAISIVDSVVDTINNKLSIDFNMLNLTVDYINTSIWHNLSVIESDIGALSFDVTIDYDIINSSIDNMEVNLLSAISLTESNITTLNNYIWNAINITDSIVSYLNNTIWNDITAINTTINSLNNNIWSNFTFLDSRIGEINISILNSISVIESDIGSMNTSILNAISVIDSIVSYMNNTIFINLDIINATINTIDNKISIDFNMLNLTVDYLNNTIWTEFNTIDSNIGTVETNVKTAMSYFETNITTLNNYINTTITLIDNNVEFLNNTVWTVFNDISNNITKINQSITYVNDTIWNNFTFINENITDATVNIKSYIDLSEMNLSSLNLNIWSSLNLTDSIIGYINSTIWNDYAFFNATINTINNNIWSNFSAIETDICSMNTNILSNIYLMESNITSYTQNIWNAINATDSIIGYINSTIWNDITALNTTIDTINNKLLINFDMLNTNISNINNNIWSNFSIIESTVGTIETNIINSLTLSESNLTTLSNNIHNLLTVTDSMVGYINSTIWGEINAINLTLDSLNNTMIGQFSMINSSLENVSIEISGNVSINDTTITNMLMDMWGSINITDTSISYMNTSIWGEFAITNTNIDNAHLTMHGVWDSQNASFMNIENRSTIVFNFYNTNHGLGLPRETLQVFINGSRLTNNIYYTYNETDIINVTIRDYYNTTLFHQNFTINTPYRFLDLGLTFHSWLFGNKNNEYYIISLLRENASRWWERGIVPNGEREFMIPSGNYTLRIYDASYDEIYNNTHVVNQSMVYVIEGNDLAEVIAGQSVIQGQMLELQDSLDYALMPDDVIWSTNPIVIFSVFDRIGQLLGGNVWEVCPPVTVVASTRTTLQGNNISSTAILPSNNTVATGTVSLVEDVIYFSGSANWVNITYADTGVTIQNTSYVPTKLYFNGENISIVSDSDIIVLREILYSHTRQFYWNIYNSTVNPGHIAHRAGYHSTGLTISNPLNTSIYNVYVFAGFSDRTTPDYNSVRVYDVENGIVLEMGENFKVTGNGIEFKIAGGISANSAREFTLSYYSDVSTSYYYDDVQVTVRTYETGKTFGTGDKLYNRVSFMWVNDNILTFRGSIRVKFDYSVNINKDEVYLVNLNTNNILDSDKYIVADNYIFISSGAIGDVGPGNTRNYAIYYQEKVLPGKDVDEYTLNTPLFVIAGINISMFFFIVILSIFLMALGLFLIFREKKINEKYMLLIILGLAISFIFWILQAKGV